MGGKGGGGGGVNKVHYGKCGGGVKHRTKSVNLGKLGWRRILLDYINSATLHRFEKIILTWLCQVI